MEFEGFACSVSEGLHIGLHRGIIRVSLGLDVFRCLGPKGSL